MGLALLEGMQGTPLVSCNFSSQNCWAHRSFLGGCLANHRETWEHRVWECREHLVEGMPLKALQVLEGMLARGTGRERREMQGCFPLVATLM